MLVAGVDEAGRGPVIGPLVVCSVAILEKDLYLLENIGVKDSKYLSSKKRQEIYDWFFEKKVRQRLGLLGDNLPR